VGTLEKACSLPCRSLGAGRRDLSKAKHHVPPTLPDFPLGEVLHNLFNVNKTALQAFGSVPTGSDNVRLTIENDLLAAVMVGRIPEERMIVKKNHMCYIICQVSKP
jgi:hypothetical protein